MPTFETILYAAMWFFLFGGLFGLALAFFSKVFHVEKDPLVDEILSLLPGANCAGCGYTGCDACAAAIAAGKAEPTACTVASDEAHRKIAALLGVKIEKSVRYRAQVMCSGTSDLAEKKYLYDGAADCISANRLSGGDKRCPYGCIGLGSCASACKFGAIHIINGVAAIDYNACVGCGTCVRTCPKHIIELVPFDTKYWVGCKSHDKGSVLRDYCEVGCIGCKICEKNCPNGAITVTDSVAQINYELCTGCGICEEKCPRKIIWSGASQRKEGIVRGDEDLAHDRAKGVKSNDEL